jgi:release factor glutamine methyltransferase
MKSKIPQEYKDGSVDFLDCKIDLSFRPLIPRPETEFWAKAAILDLARLRAKSIRVLDMFSGSGCMGIAVAKNLPKAFVDFGDIDPLAIKQIELNIKINNVKKTYVRIFKSDIFKNIPQCLYDAILANPPYIDYARIGEVQDSVIDWEPRAALFADNKGLAVIEEFLKKAKNFLKPEGFVYMEFDFLQKDCIKEIIERNGYLRHKFFKDQFNRWRFVKIVN